MKQQILKKLGIFILALCFVQAAKAQVTIGSGIAPTKGALLELKTQQANADNETTGIGGGGFILPRVNLQGLRTLKPLLTDTEATDELKKELMGLMVYNLYTDNLPKPVLYPGVYIWDGEQWGTSGINKSATPMHITDQPQSFSFYETGTETVTPLEFSVDPPLDQEGNVSGTVSYQWYQVTGGNVHVRVGAPVTQGTGGKTATYSPTQIIKGTTRNANNAGFYKFYCEASANGARVTSDIVEVAVGCGAKNNAGEWLTFMCFNLGADNNSTINSQIDYPIGTIINDPNGLHTYIVGEENLWGDLYQWGRVRDGHQSRTSEVISGNAMTLADLYDGPKYNTNDTPWPYQQIAPNNITYFGKFINGIVANSNNWRPLSNTADGMWRNGNFRQNDPCARYRIDGSYTDLESNENPGTIWRLPSLDEWGAIYRGGSLTGSASIATANTWSWNNKNGKGFELRPDGKTTTLFLPASGYRPPHGLLFNQGQDGNYWSSSAYGNNSYWISIRAGSVNPANANPRAYGFALRCIKHN